MGRILLAARRRLLSPSSLFRESTCDSLWQRNLLPGLGATDPRRKFFAVPAVMHHERLVQVRSFAKEAAPPATSSLKGDEMLKNIFYEVKNKFDTALRILKKEKITIDPDDSTAVSQYAKVMKTIREKADLFSESQRVKYTIEQRTRDLPDVQTYLLALQEIRIKTGLTDDLGVEALMFEALEKIEKEIKKPLLRSDKKNMALLQAEFDKINKKLGIRKEDLSRYEEDLELKIAKAELQELKKDAVEAMETQLKRLYSILCSGELTGLNAKCSSTLMAQHLLAAADRYALERLRLLCELSFV